MTEPKEMLSLNTLLRMVDDGEIDLQLYKRFFRAFKHRETTLTDVQLLVAVGNTDDDMEASEWADLIERVEQQHK